MGSTTTTGPLTMAAAASAPTMPSVEVGAATAAGWATAWFAALLIVVVAHRLRPRPGDRGAGTAGPGGGATSVADRMVRAVANRRRRRRSRRPPSPAAVADWCADVARVVRAGETLRAALLRTVPSDDAMRTAVAPLRHALERGRSVADAAAPAAAAVLARAGRSARSDGLALAMAVVAACGRLGGSAAAPLDRVATTLRQRAADDQERSAQSAQARLSAHVLTVVPLGVLATLLLADASVRSAVTTSAGAGCVAAGVALNGAGWCWMRRIVRPVGR